MFTGLSLSCWYISVCVLNFQKIRAALIARYYTASNSHLTMIYCSFLPNKQAWTYSVTRALQVTSYYKLLQSEYECRKKSFQLHMQRIDQSYRYHTDAAKSRGKNSPTLSLLELFSFSLFYPFPIHLCCSNRSLSRTTGFTFVLGLATWICTTYSWWEERGLHTME